MCVQIRFPHRCRKGIIRVTGLCIFELAVILLLSLFWNNRISTTTTASQQPRHPHHSTNSNISSPPSPQRTTSHLHLHKRRHLINGNSVLNEHLCRQTRGFPVRAGVDDSCNVRAWLTISPTSAHVRVLQRDRIKITKGAGPAGGEG